MRTYSIELRAKVLKKMEHALRNPCPLCGAQAGEPCISRNGKLIMSIGMTHDARLTDQPRNKTHSLRRYWT